MNDGSPAMVVSLLPARSAEPPHSSGSTGGERVQDLAGCLSGGHALGVGRERGQRAGPAVRQLARGSRSSSARRSGSAGRPGGEGLVPGRPGLRCRARATWRAWATRSGSAGKSPSGSKPRICLVAATSSAPRAEPCAAPVFCLFGAGQPMMVRSAISDGAAAWSLAVVSARCSAAHVLAVAAGAAPAQPLHVPAVGLVPGGHVLGLRDRRVVLDRDVRCRRTAAPGCRAAGARPATRPRG